MIQLEISDKHQETYNNARMLAEHMMRPYSRKYDKAEHEYPKEMEKVAKLMAGSRNTSSEGKKPESESAAVKNSGNMGAVIGMHALAWGDLGLFMAIPGSGLGNAAINSVGTPEQRNKYANAYAAMCITEPSTGSDSANISTTAVREGDQWVINGEKIFVSDGERCDTLVVWATLDKSLGKAAIKSFIVEKGTPGCEVTRLEHKMGIRASDTASISFNDCRVPLNNILGSPEIATDEEIGGAEMHAEVAGTADYLAENDADGIRIAREVMASLAWNSKHNLPAKPDYQQPVKHQDSNVQARG